MRIFLGVCACVLVLWLAWLSVYTVDQGEFAYVMQFGQRVAVRDGQKESGLYGKLPWPIQTVRCLDRRLQSFDLPETELLTHDPEGQTIDKTLTVVAYVCWRIDPDNVDLFIRRLGTPDRARTILGERIRSQLGALIGQMRMDDLISVDQGRVEHTVEKLRNDLLHETDQGQGEQTRRSGSSLQELAKREYGITLVDIRLRRTSHPTAVRASIFERIRSERNKKVADYQSEGARQAEDIKSAAERDYRNTVADAQAQAQRLKGEAETEADKIRNDAHSQDVEFYTFLKKLDQYQRILGDNKTMLLLSSHGDLFDVLFKPPKPVTPGTTTGATPPGTPARGGEHGTPAQGDKGPAKMGGR